MRLREVLEVEGFGGFVGSKGGVTGVEGFRSSLSTYF